MARPTKHVPTRVPVPLAAPDSALRERAWAAFTLGLLSVIGLLFIGDLRRGVYVVTLTLVFGLLALVIGVSTSRRARRAGMARPRGAMSGAVFGGMGFTLSTICLVAFAVFWPQLKAYSSCLDGANTVTAQQTCQNQFSQSVTNEINRLKADG